MDHTGIPVANDGQQHTTQDRRTKRMESREKQKAKRQCSLATSAIVNFVLLVTNPLKEKNILPC